MFLLAAKEFVCANAGTDCTKITKMDYVGEKDLGLTWCHAANLAARAGGRLPLAQEMVDCRITDGDKDFWQPIGDKGSNFWLQTGDAGRLYTREVPHDAWSRERGCAWGESQRPEQWRATTQGSQRGSAIHYFYVYGAGESPQLDHNCSQVKIECSEAWQGAEEGGPDEEGDLDAFIGSDEMVVLAIAVVCAVSIGTICGLCCCKYSKCCCWREAAPKTGYGGAYNAPIVVGQVAQDPEKQNP